MIPIEIQDLQKEMEIEMEQPEKVFEPKVSEIRFKPAIKKAVPIQVSEPVLTKAESIINPQNNQKLKKLLKKQKKDARRANFVLTQHNDDYEME